MVAPPQQRLYFFPEPHGHRSLRPTLGPLRRGWGVKAEPTTDVLLRVTSTAICGTDLHFYQGRMRGLEGQVIGHEPLGRVEEAGSAVKNVKKGDRAGGVKVVRLRLSSRAAADGFGKFDDVFGGRLADANEFYDRITPNNVSEDERRVHRQALAGMLWSKPAPGASTPIGTRLYFRILDALLFVTRRVL